MADLGPELNDAFETYPRIAAMAAAPLPDANPKTRFGAAKPGLSAVPPMPLFLLGAVMSGGAAKYGSFNFRQEPISTSTYYDAMMRHLMAWWDGQDVDPESGQPHLAHVMACCCLTLDAASLGKLLDNRPVPGATAAHLAASTTPPADPKNS